MKPTSTKSFSSFEEARQANFEGMELPEEFFQGNLALIIGYSNMTAFLQYLKNIGTLPNGIIKWIMDGGLEGFPDYLKRDDLTVFWQAGLLRATTVEYCITKLQKETQHIETCLFPCDYEAVLDLL